jgi:DNA mismatch endonuclease (patch repair protein)
VSKLFAGLTRSELMSRIRSRGNKDTELALAKLLRAHGVSGWRRHLLVRVAVDSSKLKVDGRKRHGKDNQPSTKNHQLTVRPDFVFAKSRTAIFVDGCFWHGCPRHGTQPKGNAAFWKKKFAANRNRDRLVNQTLRRANWRVIRIWECALKKHPLTCLRRIQLALAG